MVVNEPDLKSAWVEHMVTYQSLACWWRFGAIENYFGYFLRTMQRITLIQYMEVFGSCRLNWKINWRLCAFTTSDWSTPLRNSTLGELVRHISQLVNRRAKNQLLKPRQVGELGSIEVDQLLPSAIRSFGWEDQNCVSWIRYLVVSFKVSPHFT